MAWTVTPPPFGSTGTEQEVELEGAIYTLGLRWNDRASTWFLAIGDADGVTVIEGLPLRAGVATSYAHRKGEGLPPGSFFCLDTSNKDGDPGFDDMANGRCKLMYLEASELAEFGL